MRYLAISAHSEAIKHRVLTYYLNGCVKQSGLKNFGYLETHGASGICWNKDTGDFVAGSPKLVRNDFPDIPMRICEIDPEKKETLDKEVFNGDENTKTFLGDCNELIDKLLDMPERAWYFVFIDPSGLRSDTVPPRNQLAYNTVRKIIGWRNCEILLNFPLESIWRLGGYAIQHPNGGGHTSFTVETTKKWYDGITEFYGSEDWVKYYDPEAEKPKRRFDTINLVDHYIAENLQPYYHQPVQKCLIKNKDGGHLFYLIFATNVYLGYDFMRKAFHKVPEWHAELCGKGDLDGWL